MDGFKFLILVAAAATAIGGAGMSQGLQGLQGRHDDTAATELPADAAPAAAVGEASATPARMEAASTHVDRRQKLFDAGFPAAAPALDQRVIR